MFPQTTGKTETDIRLPFLFILFALLSFLTAQGLLLLQTDPIIAGGYRSPVIWTAVHLLLLGFATMVAMGAMYQLVPVAFLVPLWSVRLGFVQFVITAIGILSLAVSFSFKLDLLAVSGGLTVAGILLFLLQMAMTIPKQKDKNAITLFVTTALICFLLTIVLGLMLAISLSSGRVLFDHLVLLKSHILLGLAGWFTLLIIGFSYKLVPMFSLAHGFPMTLSRWVYAIYVAGLVVTLMSFLLNNQLLFSLGLILLLAGFSLFITHIRQILNKRMKKRLDKGLTFALASLVAGWGVHFAMVIASFLPSQDISLARLIYLYVFIWITFTICGYLFKIVPFLWWTYKYSKKAGKKDTPLLQDLINDRFASANFRFMTIAIIGIVLSFAFTLPFLFLLSQALFFVATALYCIMIITVMTK